MQNKELKITFWSGVGMVTGANFMLESLHTRLLVDCGLIQGDPVAVEMNKEPFAYDPSTVDYLFITHAHMDHIGRIGMLVKAGFRGTIFSTPETKELANAMLLDALKVMTMKEKEVMDGRHQPPLYDALDVDRAMSLWKTIFYHTETKINDELSVYLMDAGHILGSSMYKFSIHGKKIVFTGDSGNSPAPLLKDTESITDADYLIVDSVYGDRNHESKEDRDNRLKEIVKESITRGGALVMPAFSIERTQVILYELNNMIEAGEIPSIPVYLDSPLGRKVTEIYSKYTKDFNKGVQGEIKAGDNIFDFPSLSITHGSYDSKKIEELPNPKIIISGSGMSSGGRVIWHEIAYLPDPKSTILLMGYQAVGTLGRRIEDKPSSVMINGQMVPIRATIEMISGYSAHKDSDNLVDLVSKTADIVKKVFVVMGEPKSSTYLAQRLHNELGVNAICPQKGDHFILL